MPGFVTDVLAYQPLHIRGTILRLCSNFDSRTPNSHNERRDRVSASMVELQPAMFVEPYAASNAFEEDAGTSMVRRSGNESHDQCNCLMCTFRRVDFRKAVTSTSALHRG
jgi:hypothetical protein